ncbi:uncharacterized protein LOC142774985 isoform X2 [Rhipicephalus microplus]|uniref:uncharacterized protein LOC142774985 isoform X2 n=1 Tax=Rhipicephalus microplus TaxID=6941 RepID=UPI003F6A6FB5
MTTTFHRESEGDESDAENDAGSDAEVPAEKKPKRTKKKKHLSRKCKGGIYLEGEVSPAHGSPDKANDVEELVPALNPDEEKKRADDLWSDFLRDVEPNPRKRTVPAANVVSAVGSNKAESETKPSAFAERLVSKVEWEAEAKTTGARRGAAKKATSDAAVDGHGDVGDGNAATLTSITSPGGLERGTNSAPAKAPLRKQGGTTKDTSSMTKRKSNKRKNSRSGSDSSGNDEPPNSVGSDDDFEPVVGPSHRQQREAPQRAHPWKKRGAAANTKQPDATGDESDTDFVKPPAKKPGTVSWAHKKALADDSESDLMSAPKKATKNMTVLSFSSSSVDDDVPAVPRPSPANRGRSRAAPVNYNFGSESSDGF